MTSFISLLKFGDWPQCSDRECKLAQHEHWHCPKEVPKKLVFPDAVTLSPVEPVKVTETFLEFWPRPAWVSVPVKRDQDGAFRSTHRRTIARYRRKYAASAYEKKIKDLHKKAWKTALK